MMSPRCMISQASHDLGDGCVALDHDDLDPAFVLPNRPHFAKNAVLPLRPLDVDRIDHGPHHGEFIADLDSLLPAAIDVDVVAVVEK